MCGRTSCTLNPDKIERLCSYQRRDGTKDSPRWTKNKDKYYPSYNKAPQSYCPILLHGKHLLDDGCDSEADERTLTAMRWGLIPSWFKDGNIDKVSYSMNNARSDTMMEKRSYKIPLRKGQRCVVLADGFYEWNTTPDGKQPYYIYFPQPQANNDDNEEDCNDSKDVRLLTMAGIFEKTFYENEDIFSFSVITVDAAKDVSWLHHRMPAILENDDEVKAWLDFENVPLKEAISLIKPKSCLKWHPVSKFVNNSRNNSPECREEVNLEELQKLSTSKHSSESKCMMKWLTSSTDISKVKTSSSPSSSTSKKRKSVGAMDRWLKKAKTEYE